MLGLNEPSITTDAPSFSIGRIYPRYYSVSAAVPRSYMLAATEPSSELQECRAEPVHFGRL
jgi:hypothetical protein